MSLQLPSSKIKAVAFDFDGTLADSFTVMVRVAEIVLDRPPFTQAEIDHLRKHSIREVIDILKVNKWKLPMLIAKGMREVDRHHHEIMPFQDIQETVRQLHEHGYKLYIASSHSEKGLKQFLERFQMTGYFDHIYGMLGLMKSKGLKKLQSQFGYAAEECILVGDEVRDIEAAKKAGMKCIAVSWGFNSTEALQKHNPHRLIDEPLELLEALQDLSFD